MVEPQSRLPESGELIGPYQIVRAIGRGGMGEVFLARDNRLNRWVAIKRIRPDSDIPALRQRLLQEAYAVGGLRHPAIVLVYDLLHEGDDCIVMEYVEGQTLAEVLRKGPLEPALAVQLAKSVASGLAAAHEAGFLHRDLKTENVMVTPTWEVKILDFGLAKPIGITDGLTATGRVVGTRRSMSPEQLRDGELDERSDLYSLGVLLYEMLTGCSPIQGIEAPALAQIWASKLPPRLIALLVRLLAQEPAARPQSAAEVVRELEALTSLSNPPGDLPSEETLAELPAGAFLRGERDPSPQPRRRNLWWVATLFFFFLLLAEALVTIAHWYRAHRKPEHLWVLVVSPSESGHDIQSKRVAPILVEASLKILGTLQGIFPVGPILEAPKEGIGPEAVAEDFLAVTLEPSGNRGVITLSRVRGSDGKVLDDRTFTVPIDAQNLQSLEKEVEAPLRALFPSHALRDDISKAGYEEFFGIQQRIDEGPNVLKPELPKLESLIRRFPGFLDAQLLGMRVLTAMRPSLSVEDLKRARHLLERARSLASRDPRLLHREFEIYIPERKFEDAEITLSRMKDVDPGGPYNLVYQSRLAVAQGQYAEALNACRKAAKYIPTWKILLECAQAEAYIGLTEDSRRHIEQLLEIFPSNLTILSSFAAVEALHGDPVRAEEALLKIIERSPRSHEYRWLGDTHELLGRYTDAVIDYNEALKIAPDDGLAMFHLATAEFDLGEPQAATHFKKALELLDKNPYLQPSELNVMKAHCLADLGRSQEAIQILRSTLPGNSDDPYIPLMAAQVFTTAGDYTAGLEMVKRALAGKIGLAWFKLRVFSPLSKDPRFQRLLDETARERMAENHSRKPTQG
jgi:serine/threonine protein kinase/tetratricopeptide (TPR) repeat protein